MTPGEIPVKGHCLPDLLDCFCQETLDMPLPGSSGPMCAGDGWGAWTGSPGLSFSQILFVIVERISKCCF